jgi:hypothetical protein
MRTLLLSCLLLLVFSGRASADGIDVVSQSGVWGTACPAVVCSQTGDTWSYSFETPATLSGYGGNTEVTSPITDFDFYLNGAPVASLTGAYTEAIWFPQDDDGGFGLGNDGSFGLNIAFAEWDQLYNFANYCAPSVLVPGVYNVTGSQELFFGTGGGFLEDPTAFIPGPVVITAVPEPSTLMLIVTGLLALAIIARRNSPNRKRQIPVPNFG